MKSVTVTEVSYSYSWQRNWDTVNDRERREENRKSDGRDASGSVREREKNQREEGGDKFEVLADGTCSDRTILLAPKREYCCFVYTGIQLLSSHSSNFQPGDLCNHVISHNKSRWVELSCTEGPLGGRVHWRRRASTSQQFRVQNNVSIATWTKTIYTSTILSISILKRICWWQKAVQHVTTIFSHVYTHPE